MLAASKVKMSCREKKRQGTPATKFLVSTYDNSSLKITFFFLVRSIDFVAVLVAVAVYYLIHDFLFYFYKYLVNESFAFNRPEVLGTLRSEEATAAKTSK